MRCLAAFLAALLAGQPLAVQAASPYYPQGQGQPSAKQQARCVVPSGGMVYVSGCEGAGSAAQVPAVPVGNYTTNSTGYTPTLFAAQMPNEIVNTGFRTYAAAPPTPRGSNIGIDDDDETGGAGTGTKAKPKTPQSDPVAAAGAAIVGLAAAALGFALGGPIGACVGFVIGALVGALMAKAYEAATEKKKDQQGSR